MIKGEKNKNSKLTTKQVMRILGSRQSGRALAKVYNVDRRTIDRIRTKETWAHVQA